MCVTDFWNKVHLLVYDIKTWVLIYELKFNIQWSFFDNVLLEITNSKDNILMEALFIF